MGLTPVHVRRKRKSPHGNAPAALQSEPSATKMRASLATVLTKRAFRKRTNIHSLPTEIIENILLYSRNLYLPQADPLIGIKLSDKATLLRLFILAFQDTWHQWFGIPAGERILCGPRTADPQSDLCDGDYVLQTAILKLPWVTIDLVLQAQQTWADNYARNRWYQHCVPWDHPSPSSKHDHDGNYGHFNARECFEVDYQQALKWVPFRLESEDWRTQDVHPRTRLPHRLIAGPWDDKSQRLLFWLTRGGIQIDGESQALLPWEDKFDCLSCAILDVPEPNVLVVNCLIRDWVFQDLPQDMVRKELVNISNRLKWGSHSQEAKAILLQTRNALDTSALFREFHENN